MKKIIFITLPLFFLIININAQTLYNFNLYPTNASLYNPAATVNNGDYLRCYLNSHLQWVGMDGFPKNNTAGFSLSSSKNMAFGATIFNRTHGIMNNTRFRASYAYQLRFDKKNKHYLKMGVALGAVNNKLLNNNAKNVDIADPELNSGNYNKISLTSGFGLLYHLPIGRLKNKAFEIEIVSPIIFEAGKPNFFGLAAASYIFIIRRKWEIKSTALVRNTELVKAQGDFIMKIYNIQQGWWLLAGVRSNKSAIAGFGTRISNNIAMSYAYQPIIGSLALGTTGSHEVQIRIKIAKRKSACPAYH